MTYQHALHNRLGPEDQSSRTNGYLSSFDLSVAPPTEYLLVAEFVHGRYSLSLLVLSGDNP